MNILSKHMILPDQKPNILLLKHMDMNLIDFSHFFITYISLSMQASSYEFWPQIELLKQHQPHFNAYTKYLRATFILYSQSSQILASFHIDYL